MNSRQVDVAQPPSAQQADDFMPGHSHQQPSQNAASDRRPGRRRLIVNADDFGMSPGINRGVLAAHQGGIVTSASLLVRWPAAAEAVAHAREHPRLSLGLHVDLGEWTYRGQAWVARYEVAPLDDRSAVAAEVERQLGLFRRLTGRDPTHLDSHQHVHMRPPVRPVLAALARELSVPLRHFNAHVCHYGGFYGQSGTGEPLPERITAEALVGCLAGLPAGLTELACHPGLDDALQTMYAGERAMEVAALCDPRVRAALAALDIELCSFHSLPCPVASP
jgi:predicted glycoside hydrolase/deacetylase ChbG (UPF0249 family)